MAKPEDRRFGTPYDPKYSGGGKIERPQAQHQTRGCGDPNCASCNPETAALGGSNNPARERMATLTGRNSGIFMGGGAIPRNIQEAMAEAMRSEIRSLGAGRMSWPYGGIEFTESSEPAAKRPSAAYRAAREKVEGYITKAPEQAFDDIVGNDEALATLRDAIRAPVENKELYEAYGMKMPKGALLSGPPGCGKTMFAKAAAAEMKKLYGETTEFLSVSGGELQTMYVGETEAKIRAIFDFAREYKAFHGHPLLVFMDEAEVLLPDRTGRIRRVAPWEESQVATFLAEMDGIKESGAFVLLATNRPETIDQAVLRDGRCDFKIVVKRPTVEALETILSKSFAKAPLLKDTPDDLVFAALEAFVDPSKIITEAHYIEFRDKKFSDLGGKNFTLEHIVSGAMAASIPSRATRYAFQRDKALGIMSGITVSDVLKAVNALFDENKGLEHAFAMDEFKQEFESELRVAGKLK